MSQSVAVKEVTSKTMDKQTPLLRLPDAASAAEVALAQAMEYCAQKMGLAGAQAAMARVQEGDPVACGYCHYSIAKQVAEVLGALDENVHAAYVFDYDATPQDLCFGSAQGIPPVHLLVWTERRTEALNSLADAFDRALAQRLCELTGQGPRAHVLDMQFIDRSDIENRTGYGALLSSLYHRPIKVWER